MNATIAVLLAGLSSTMAAATLPLRPGDYALTTDACHDAPFATLRNWDGHGFGDPHDSRCSTVILSRAGARYHIATTCRAQGDGTPSPPSTVRETIRILSPTRFAIGTGRSEVYRWCPASD